MITGYSVNVTDDQDLELFAFLFSTVGVCYHDYPQESDLLRLLPTVCCVWHQNVKRRYENCVETGNNYYTCAGLNISE